MSPDRYPYSVQTSSRRERSHSAMIAATGGYPNFLQRIGITVETPSNRDSIPTFYWVWSISDAFALEHKRDVRVDATMALELDCEDILSNLVVKQEVAQQFKLTPVPVPVDPPAKRAKKMKEEVSLNETTVATGDAKMDRESSPESGSDSSDSN